MKDFERTLKRLGEEAREEKISPVDVTHQVLQSIHLHQPVKLDWAPLLLGGVAIAAAVLGLLLYLPSWHIIFDPWANYYSI